MTHHYAIFVAFLWNCSMMRPRLVLRLSDNKFSWSRGNGMWTVVWFRQQLVVTTSLVMRQLVWWWRRRVCWWRDSWSWQPWRWRRCDVVDHPADCHRLSTAHPAHHPSHSHSVLPVSRTTLHTSTVSIDVLNFWLNNVLSINHAMLKRKLNGTSQPVWHF